MIISVVVPKLQKAQWERIEEEFKDIEYEMIPTKDIGKALTLATGRFIVFLEEDSAFAPGSLRTSLEVFRNNPSYRKLAMVSTTVDYDNLEDRYGFGYDGGVELSTAEDGSEEPYPVSIGYFYGSIIRTTAYRKADINLRRDALYRSVQLSDIFWSKGLRVELNPLATYFSPAATIPEPSNAYKIKGNAESLKVWSKEFIL